MLFQYNLPALHRVQLLHECVEHFITDICHNATGAWANADILRLNPALQTVFSGGGRPPKMRTYIENIYNACAGFSQAQRDYLRQAFSANNNIEAICNRTQIATTYSDIAHNTNQNFADTLKDFCDYLYEAGLGLSAFSSLANSLTNYYAEFIAANNTNAGGLCAFCGLTALKTPNLPVRDAFDHFLPRCKYPFNTVNISNLPVACKDCNESYKKTLSPIINAATSTARKAFYPFGSEIFYGSAFDISIQIVKLDKHDTALNVLFIHKTQTEETASWQDVYKVEARYKHCLETGETAYFWWASVYEEGQDAVIGAIRKAKRYNFSDKNFLKIPFLEACLSAGYF